MTLHCVSHRYLFTLDLPEYWENKHADQTLEVLMSDLDPAIMDQFYMKDGVSASDVTRVSRCHQCVCLDSHQQIKVAGSSLGCFEHLVKQALTWRATCSGV